MTDATYRNPNKDRPDEGELGDGDIDFGTEIVYFEGEDGTLAEHRVTPESYQQDDSCFGILKPVFYFRGWEVREYLGPYRYIAHKVAYE